jgi:hypothetical protein
MIVVGLYFLARYGGFWAESDSANFTRFIRDYVAHGSMLPPVAEIYPNGYLDQALSTFIVSLTGMQVETLQQLVYPLVAAIGVPVAWMAYRALTGSAAGATASAALLFTQPEFLFVFLRSSHEKFTRILMLVCLFLLVKIITTHQNATRKLVLGGLYCAAAYAMIASNVLMAASFAIGIGSAFAIGVVIGIVKPRLARTGVALGPSVAVLVAASLGLVALFMLVAYPPATHNIRVLNHTIDQVNALLTGMFGGGTATQSSNVLGAYSYVTSGWVSPAVYLILSAGNWLLLTLSLAVWIRLGWRWLIRNQGPPTRTAWLLWLLYAALAFQGGIAVLSDASGALESNLELRLFPSFAMVGAALLGSTLADWIGHARGNARPLALSVALSAVSILSVFKVTNEPIFSNKWTFYRPGELTALAWADDHLRNAFVWTEFDDRIGTALHFRFAQLKNSYDSSVATYTRDMAVSDVTRVRAARLGQPLPVPPDAWQIYDNGVSQLYHLRADTPYQP